ncbi:hypothetical protein ANO11243_021970 [Dothideomycetidae sp. 11243]|nr:hypothetical protein ANO11243_021970 [fungal sp. No.11243]
MGPQRSARRYYNGRSRWPSLALTAFQVARNTDFPSLHLPPPPLESNAKSTYRTPPRSTAQPKSRHLNPTGRQCCGGLTGGPISPPCSSSPLAFFLSTLRVSDQVGPLADRAKAWLTRGEQLVASRSVYTSGSTGSPSTRSPHQPDRAILARLGSASSFLIRYRSLAPYLNFLTNIATSDGIVTPSTGLGKGSAGRSAAGCSPQRHSAPHTPGDKREAGLGSKFLPSSNSYLVCKNVVAKSSDYDQITYGLLPRLAMANCIQNNVTVMLGLQPTISELILAL